MLSLYLKLPFRLVRGIRRLRPLIDQPIAPPINHKTNKPVTNKQKFSHNDQKFDRVSEVTNKSEEPKMRKTQNEKFWGSSDEPQYDRRDRPPSRSKNQQPRSNIDTSFYRNKPNFYDKKENGKFKNFKNYDNRRENPSKNAGSRYSHVNKPDNHPTFDKTRYGPQRASVYNAPENTRPYSKGERHQR